MVTVFTTVGVEVAAEVVVVVGVPVPVEVPVLVEVPVMLGLVHAALWTRRLFFLVRPAPANALS